MVQIRVMSDDGQAVEDVLQTAHRWLSACPDLVVGDPTRLSHRGGGGRVVFEVMLVRPAVRVEHAERVDPPAGGPPVRRALPPV